MFSAHAYAHEGVSAGGFVSGLSHPVLGFDHFLAMLSVGILSAQLGGRAIWSVPLTFVMVVGGWMGMRYIDLPYVEPGIALFALFHGHAHGSEMPYIADPILYSVGFVVGTAGIHLAGVGLGVISRRFASGASLLRYLGAAIAGIGTHILMGI